MGLVSKLSKYVLKYSQLVIENTSKEQYGESVHWNGARAESNYQIVTCIDVFVKKEKKSDEKMSRSYGGMSFVTFLLLYFINFCFERTNNNRFGIRIVRKTKLKKFQAVDENEFYDVTNSQAGETENCDGKTRKKKAIKRNTVTPAPRKKEAWSKTNGKKPCAANKYSVQESCYTDLTEIVEEDGKMTFKTSVQKWDLKTGKEIKLSKSETNESSSSVGTDPMSSFLNVLTPPTADNFNVCNSDPHHGSLGDLFCPEDDIPGPSGVCIKNEVIIDLTEDNGWVDTGKRMEKKSALSKFCSKFKRRPKINKLRKILA